MPLLRLVLRSLRPYWLWIALVIVFQIVGVLASLYLPTLNADIIDDGVAKADVDRIESALWWHTGETADESVEPEQPADDEQTDTTGKTTS